METLVFKWLGFAVVLVIVGYAGLVMLHLLGVALRMISHDTVTFSKLCYIYILLLVKKKIRNKLKYKHDWRKYFLTLEQYREYQRLKTQERKINKERILCSAIWVDDGKKYDHQPRNITSGLVICGRRHHNVFITLKQIFNMDAFIQLKQDKKVTQGFLTSDDKFVNRKEAQRIAVKIGQIKSDFIGSVLTSEDLW